MVAPPDRRQPLAREILREGHSGSSGITETRHGSVPFFSTEISRFDYEFGRALRLDPFFFSQHDKAKGDSEQKADPIHVSPGAQLMSASGTLAFDRTASNASDFQ